MHIIQITAENYKKIKAVSIKPSGAVTQISGPNGSGKTSLLDAIYGALAGKKALPSKPIRRGEASARITLDLGDVIVTRRFTRNDESEGDTSVVVESAEGARFPSPQRMLDDLFGSLSFDPLAFTRAEPKAQLDTLRGLVTLDTDIDALDAENQKDFEDRKQVNRTIKSLQERYLTLHAGVETEADVTLIDEESLLAQMETASAHNSAIDAEIRSRSDRHHRIETLRKDAIARGNEIEALLNAISGLRVKQQELSNSASLLESAISTEPLPDPIDIREVRTQLNVARAHNSRAQMQIAQREKFAAASAELQAAKDASNILTETMERRSALKASTIASATMPIDGLSFGDGAVLYNDLPLDQASMAEQIRVSMAIAMASNPKLRVILVKDASLLDEQSLAIVEQMAEAHDFQVFLETVSTGGKIGVLLDAGEVVSIDGVRVGNAVEFPS